MELGNMVFGCSRGSFPIKRSTGWEEELGRLFDAYEEHYDRYGPDYENDTFKVMSYYWGDCTCGYDDMPEFTGLHNSDCYQTPYRALKDALKIKGVPMFDEEETREVKKLCDHYGLPHPSGCAVHCTCDYYDRLEKWHENHGYPGGHKPECMFRQPNFLHKPSGFDIDWYKYPLRDSYKNQDISLEQFREIIDDCIKSVSQV